MRMTFRILTFTAQTLCFLVTLSFWNWPRRPISEPLRSPDSGAQVSNVLFVAIVRHCKSDANVVGCIWSIRGSCVLYAHRYAESTYSGDAMTHCLRYIFVVQSENMKLFRVFYSSWCVCAYSYVLTSTTSIFLLVVCGRLLQKQSHNELEVYCESSSNTNVPQNHVAGVHESDVSVNGCMKTITQLWNATLATYRILQWHTIAAK